jgi:hypothetical protein
MVHVMTCVAPAVWQEYAYHYGDLWQTSSSSLSDRVHEQSSQELGASTFSAPLKWLLAFRGLPTMTQQEQRKHKPMPVQAVLLLVPHALVAAGKSHTCRITCMCS